MKWLNTVALLVLLSVGLAIGHTPDTSIDQFRKESGYTGQICFPKQDGRTCEDGIPYNRSTVVAGSSYNLWVACKLHPDLKICLPE